MIQCVLSILEIGYIKIWDLRPSKALILGTLRRIRCSEGNGYALRFFIELNAGAMDGKRWDARCTWAVFVSSRHPDSKTMSSRGDNIGASDHFVHMGSNVTSWCPDSKSGPPAIRHQRSHQFAEAAWVLCRGAFFVWLNAIILRLYSKKSERH